MKVKKVSSDLKVKRTSLFQKKTRGSVKLPHSKSSYSRLNFCNQLIRYSMFLVSLWAIINTEGRTLRASLCVAVVEVT